MATVIQFLLRVRAFRMKIPTIFQKKKNVVSIKTEKTFSSQQNTELNKILKVRKCSILGNNKARLEKDFHVLL